MQVPIWPIGKDEASTLALATDAYINDQAEGSNKKLAAFLRQHASGIALVMAIGEVAGPRASYSLTAKRLRQKNARTVAQARPSSNGRHAGGATGTDGRGVSGVAPIAPEVVSAFASEENG
jgi:hypothetical protein